MDIKINKISEQQFCFFMEILRAIHTKPSRTRNFNTPKVEGQEGKVYITFVVDVDGTLTDFKILRDVGFGTGEEAIRVVKNYNGWIPGEQRGRKVRCHYSLPINVKSKR